MVPEILLQVQKLEKYYPGQSQDSPTLSDISFQVNTGEVVSIMGHSGCGKSTLLNVIGGFVRPDQGCVLFKGEVVERPQRTRVMLSQDYGLLPWRSVLKNVELGLEELPLTTQERHQRAFEYLELVGLQDSSEKFPHQISGGMQQRVALARALAVQPELLLMDEPFAALDAFNRYRLQDELLRIQKHEKRTVIIVTHDIDEAIYLSDKILIMRDKTGRIDREIPIEIPKPRDRGHNDFQELRKIIFNEFVDNDSEIN